MERTRNMKKGLRAATVVVFFAAALLSTGCSNNALMNPQIDSAQSSTPTAHSAGGNEQNPVGGNEQNP